MTGSVDIGTRELAYKLVKRIRKIKKKNEKAKDKV
jgi:hypothetical protein